MQSVAGDLGEPLSVLRVDGGLTRSAVLMQAQADLAQTSIELYPAGHATALGAAATARLALDPSPSVTDAVGGWVPEQVYTPGWSADRAESFLTAWEHALVAGLTARDPA
jgi:glycerol kinase